MKLNTDIKREIQCFVYFLFSGALSDSSKNSSRNYLDKILDNPQMLYDCFEVFAYANQKEDSLPPNGEVTEYLEYISENQNHPQINKIKSYNESKCNYWTDFLGLAKKFCFNKFDEEGIQISIKDLYQCGTDAVPIFAIWTNLVELNEQNEVINKAHVMNRLSQRFNHKKQFEYFPKFEEWELEQEIY